MKYHVVIGALLASVALAVPSSESNQLFGRQHRPVRPPGNCCGNTECDPACVRQ
ncbi:hypothetical protein CCHL11_04581 [Colletotrichum chlorophyti]|uniref:Uncharacterized protein n=1 Tax=Colletotrichum chlorophyti TaxID=708187 RepID=A0A1Q8RRG7_9PEZI|nr:hypothetical protein CCHL11_04581 [Colletotrichum chlorophyti]